MSFQVADFQDFVAEAAAADLARLAAILEGLRGPTAGLAQRLRPDTRIVSLAALDPAAVAPDVIAAAVLDAVAAFANGTTPALALDGLELLTHVTFPQPLMTATAARRQQAENAERLTALVQQAAAAALPGPVSTVPLMAYEDLVAVRTRVVDLIDFVQEAAQADAAVFAALDELRTQCIAELKVRGATLRPLRRYETEFPRPSLTLAQRLYQDPSRAEELVAWTGAVHPGFLPLTGLVGA